MRINFRTDNNALRTKKTHTVKHGFSLLWNKISLESKC